MPSGFEDYWVTGARAYFQREGLDVDDNENPWEDMGVIDVVSPEIAPAEISLKDSDGGLKKIVDFRVTEISETYKIKCSNLNLDNLSRLFLSNKPADAGWGTATEYIADHNVTPGRLVKIKDTAGVLRYKLATVAGLYDGAIFTRVISDITVSGTTYTIKITGNHAADPGLAAGKKIIVKKTGLTEILNSKTYTVVSAAFSTTTNIIVEEAPETAEASITGSLIYEDTGTVFSPGDDWEVASLDRGFIRIIEDSTEITSAQDLKVVFTAAAIEGSRLISPQTIRGQLRGKMIIFWGRNNNAEQSAREFTVVMTPNAANFQVDNYSDITFNCQVLTDPTSDVPAGKLIQITGDLPTLS